jgi:hypothetical protein
MKDRFYNEWLSILGEDRINGFREPIDVTTVFPTNDGLQAPLWFPKDRLESDIIQIQRFHLNQINPNSEPNRFSLHPDYSSRPHAHRDASSGFQQMQMALGDAETFEQIWGLMVYGTMYRHCLSQKSQYCDHYNCHVLLQAAKDAAGPHLPEFDKKSWHVMPDVDTDETLYKLPDEQANIWIANIHCRLLDTYSFKTVQLTMGETEASRSVRKEMEEETRRQIEWRKGVGNSSCSSSGNTPPKNGPSL